MQFYINQQGLHTDTSFIRFLTWDESVGWMLCTSWTLTKVDICRSSQETCSTTGSQRDSLTRLPLTPFPHSSRPEHPPPTVSPSPEIPLTTRLRAGNRQEVIITSLAPTKMCHQVMLEHVHKILQYQPVSCTRYKSISTDDKPNDDCRGMFQA